MIGERGKAAVFLDRDGTINEDLNYIGDCESLHLIDGAAQAIRELNDLSIQVVVVTNQSGIGRGYFTEEDFSAVTERLQELLLNEGGARVDATYHCPHLPPPVSSSATPSGLPPGSGGCCRCRKPAPGMVEAAAKDLGIDLKRSYVVGDKPSDIGLTAGTGLKGVLVLTGKGRESLGDLGVEPDHVGKNLLEAVRWIIEDIN